MFHKTNKVLARKGSKMVHRNVSLSREFITVIVCGNPNGNYLPPHIVFPEKKKRKLEGCDLEVTLEERIKLLSIGFWVDERWHRQTVVHRQFPKNIGPARPQVICDGHSSHNKLVEQAKQNDIFIVELPSHTSNLTQPFDRTEKSLEHCH